MKEKIINSYCGNNCYECPRFNSENERELRETAELWFRLGLRDRVVSPDEISCLGCGEHRACPFGFNECVKAHKLKSCEKCESYPCDRVENERAVTEKRKNEWIDMCDIEEYEVLDKAFFQKSGCSLLSPR